MRYVVLIFVGMASIGLNSPGAHAQDSSTPSQETNASSTPAPAMNEPGYSMQQPVCGADEAERLRLQELVDRQRQYIRALETEVGRLRGEH